MPQYQDDQGLTLHTELLTLKSRLDKFTERVQNLEERVQDIEIHENLLTRLLTTLCIEKFGMRVGVLKRLIKRIENEAIRDSQILHLETLYKMPTTPTKKGEAAPESPKPQDPWDEIS